MNTTLTFTFEDCVKFANDAEEIYIDKGDVFFYCQHVVAVQRHPNTKEILEYIESVPDLRAKISKHL